MDAMMNNMKMQVEVDPTEDTEWNDILREKGVIPERPPSPTAELERALDEAVKKQHENRLEGLDIDDLEELEDEEDEEFLNSYKSKRMQEIKKLSERKKFGSVLPIAKNEYEDEVTKASNDCIVFVHLSLQSSLQSRLLASIMIDLAYKFPEIKFCDIPATRCIENYPEQNCPTLMVYNKGNVIKQFITLTQLGGNATRANDLERVLVDVEAVNVNDKRLLINQEDEDISEQRKFRFMKKSIKGGIDDEDSDGDFYD